MPDLVGEGVNSSGEASGACSVCFSFRFKSERWRSLQEGSQGIFSWMRVSVETNILPLLGDGLALLLLDP